MFRVFKQKVPKTPDRIKRNRERQNAILRIIGFLLILFGITLIAPLIVAVVANDQLQLSFAVSAIVLCGIGTWLYYRTTLGSAQNLRSRDGFMIVAVIWLTLSFLASVPFIIANYLADLNMHPVDIIFESVSGLTTTGATAFVGLDELPASLLFYRQWLQWLGGIGIVVLAVAIMPLLGIGGAQIYKAEAPGPFKEARIAPKISDTAKVLFKVYLVLTIICAFAYYWAGMSGFDALLHSLTTIATGGYSPHDASMGYFDSNLIKSLAIVFMILGGTSFALHYSVNHSFKSRKRRDINAYKHWLLMVRDYLRKFYDWRPQPQRYWQDEETKVYLLLILFFSLGAWLVLVAQTDYRPGDALVDSLFHVVSFMTSTGYTATDIASWPNVLADSLFIIAFIGGCQGSSAGGMKVVRIALLTKQGRREVKRLIYPQGVFSVRWNGKFLPDSLLSAVWGFFALYLITYLLFLVLFLLLGHDFVTAFAISASSLNNTGPGLGEIRNNFLNIDGTSKMLAALAMILGRLEIFTLLVLFSPNYWRR